MWDENKKKWRMEVPQGKQTRESVFQNLSFPQFCTVFWTFGVSVSKKIAIRAMFTRAAKPASLGHTGILTEILANFYDKILPLKFQTKPA